MEYKVAILGTGPSAAYAVAACKDYQVEFDVYSNRSPTFAFPGPFWLRLCPSGYHAEKKVVHVCSVGNKETYLRKQWGHFEVDPDFKNTEASFPEEAREELVYEPEPLLSQFWKDVDVNLSHNLSDDEVRKIAAKYTLVFQTFPTEDSKHMMGAYLVRYPIVSYDFSSTIGHNNCIYVGTINNAFVRYSLLFGKVHYEYPSKHVLNYDKLGDGVISYAPDIFPNAPEWNLKDVPASNVILVGRHAQWRRKVLSHEAYEQVQKELDNLLL